MFKKRLDKYMSEATKTTATTSSSSTKRIGLDDPKVDPNCTTCTDFKDWFNKQKTPSPPTTSSNKNTPPKAQSNNSAQIGTKKSNLNDDTSSAKTARVQLVPEQTSNSEYYDECPMFRDQFGRAAWSYLHTMAAHYPEKPTEVQKTKMSDFINTFAMFFPCTHCAEDFREEYVR